MSYAKYTTDALVLGRIDQGEFDCVCFLYTKDFGLVRARASAARREKSKMRYALQKYTRAEISLVKGARGFRAAGGMATDVAIGKNIRGMEAFARIAELVLRLVQGEGKNEYLFETLTEAHRSLLSENADAIPTIEIVSVARILFALGYLSSEALATTLFSHTGFALEHIQEGEKMRDTLLASINSAISETHL